MESRKKSYSWLALWFPIVLFCQGCATGIVHQRAPISKNAIPANRLPIEMSEPPKKHTVPIEWTRLRRPPVREHIIGPDDVLGVYVEEVLPSETASPMIFFPGQQESPSVGQPIRVRSDGTIFLPLVGATQLSGLTLPQATEEVRSAYLEKQILTEDRFVTVELIKARTVKVFVVRDDTQMESALTSERRKTTALELPIFENDVLHALSASGGLPSEEAFNEIWVLRGATISESQTFEMLNDFDVDISENDTMPAASEIIRIPLQVCPGQELPFLPEDVVLNDGDVVFIESRMEFFTTGGLIKGGQYPLPRDEDIDVLEAIAIAGNNAFGPVGQGVGNNFRGGPGAIIPPTSVIIVRKLESGEQVKIAVDVRAAFNDPKERVLIRNRDAIILKYRTHEIWGNVAINILRFDYLFNNGGFGIN